MTGKADRAGDQWGALADFIDNFPKDLLPPEKVELLQAGPEGYAPLDPKAKGTWRSIRTDGIPVAVAWTDWEEGFGINPLTTGYVAERMAKYPSLAKACNIEAPWAYNTIPRYIKSFDESEGVDLGPAQDGLLSGAQDFKGDVPSYGTSDSSRGDKGRNVVALKAEYNGDITKIPEARIIVCKNDDTGAFVGFYGLTSEGLFIRGQASWIEATGLARQQFNGTDVTYVSPEFIDFFDSVDMKGKTPSDAEIAKYTVPFPT